MIDIPKLAQQLVDKELSIEQAKANHGLDQQAWFRIANKIYQYVLKCVPRHPNGDHELLEEVNEKLVDHAFCCPPYVTVSEATKAQELLSKPGADPSECIDMLGMTTMQPNLRALQSIGRFARIPIFAEFQYLVDAAAKSYYSGNLPSAIITAIPVVEGMLLRWQGFPQNSTDIPSFEVTKKFIGLSHIRNPIPARPHNHMIYCRTVDSILKNHFYLPSSSSRAPVEAFNRHWALHLLKKDISFATMRNVYRTFLLIDLLTEIYLMETRMSDPRWQVEGNDTANLVSEYQQFLMTGLLRQSH